MFVRTERLVLRRFRLADAEQFAAYRSDPVVARFQSWEPPMPLAGARETVERFAQGDPSAPGWFQYAVERDSVLIGDVALKLHENLMQGELGYTFATQYQGKGYASEAVRGLLDHLFVERGLHKVSAECDVRNVASARLLERVGFTREGLRPEHTWFKGEWTDDLLWGYLNPRRPTPARSS